MEKESFLQPRNSRRMTSALTDRYHSRRSRLRELDSLNSGSDRSNYDPKDVWQRQKCGDRKWIKILDEQICEEKTNFKGNHHGKIRNHDTDSDRDWSDRDRNRIRDRDRDRNRHHSHTKKSPGQRNKVEEFRDDCGNNECRTHEADSDRDWSNRVGDTDAHDGRQSSSHQNKASGFLDDRLNSRKRTHDTDSCQDWSEADRDEDRCRRHRRKNLRQKTEVSGFLDDNGYSKSRTRNTHSSDDLSDRDRKKHCSQTRKRPRHWSQVSGVSDDHGDPEKKFSSKFHSRESGTEKSNQQEVAEQSHSSR